jgi:hypothetical protein
MVSRAGWGADESLNSEAPEYGSVVKVMYVHHTATASDYSCAEVPAIIRSLHVYHVRQNGWKDIGYNFLVDKCGTLYEGRKGGVDRPVIGAHTMGFNLDTASVSVIGTYTGSGVSPAVQDSIARVVRWKLGLGGYRADGSETLVASVDNGKYRAGQQVTFGRVSGHRDAYLTECPGTALYNQLPAIRQRALAMS